MTAARCATCGRTWEGSEEEMLRAIHAHRRIWEYHTIGIVRGDLLRIPTSDLQRCDYLFDDSTLKGAIHLDLTGQMLQCDQSALWEGILPPDPDEPDEPALVVAVCTEHKNEAEQEGLHDVHPITPEGVPA